MDRVQIKLDMTIHDDGECEEIHTNMTGFFDQKGNMDVLIYDEKLDNNATVKNMITIQSGKVSIKRTGFVQMHQHFRGGQSTENHYHHPHGSIYMKTYTNKLTYQAPSQTTDGKLIMDYMVSLNEANPRHHQFQLCFYKEETV